MGYLVAGFMLSLVVFAIGFFLCYLIAQSDAASPTLGDTLVRMASTPAGLTTLTICAFIMYVAWDMHTV